MIKKKTSAFSENNNCGAPLISIILVCRNSENTIEQTIQSIVHLNYPNIEFIVIDGESTDGTIDVLNRYNDFIDRLVVEKDSGIYDAMNKGTKLANGEYLYFIGSDDIIINSWRNLIGKLKLRNTVYYGNVYFPVTNQIYDGKFSFIKLLTRNLCHQAIFYPKAVFEKYHYSGKYPLSADFHLNLLLNSDPDFKFKFIDILIAIYSEKGISTNKPDNKFLQDHIKIMKEHYSFIIYLYIYSRKILAKCLTNR
jgi:glycosyltransferase involved in cell wall biosynthesis